MAEQLAGAFPRVELRVAAVTGITVRVEGPAVASLRPGLELTLFRRGEIFRHPITKQPLGHAEQVLGTLVVTAVEPGAATGRLVPGGRALPAPAPIPGDGARITAGRLPVAVLPTSGVQAAFDSADQTQLLLVARFSAILEKTGRFLAVDPQRVLDLVEPDARIECLTPRGGAPTRRGGRAQLPAGPRGVDPRPRDHVDLRTDRRRRSRPPACRWCRRASRRALPGRRLPSSSAGIRWMGRCARSPSATSTATAARSWSWPTSRA